MAKAIFTREFHWNRPKNDQVLDELRVGFGAFPKTSPQSFPRDFIDAAVKAGAAEEVPQKRAKKPK